MIAPFIRQQIIELGAQGMPPKSIVGQLRVSISTVYSVLHKARTRGEPIPKFSMGLARGAREATCAMVFTARNKDRLACFAQCRGLSIPQLAAQLIETILNDGLVDAILDDGKSA